MKNRVSTLVVALLPVLFLVLACSQGGDGYSVADLVTTRADWSYVQQAWGGLEVTNAAMADGKLNLECRLGPHQPTRVDSSICVRGFAASLGDHRITVHLEKGLCNGNAISALAASIAQPPPGAYEICYDDQAAGFPKIGSVVVK